MTKRIFSLLLALCLIVGLLPAVAMPHAHAADELPEQAKVSLVTQYTGLNLTVERGGEAVYTKNTEKTMTDSGSATFTGYTQAKSTVDDWNIKFEYPADGVPTLTLKGAIIDVYNNDTNKFVKQSVGAILPVANCQHPLKVVIAEDSTIETNYGIIRGDSASSTYFHDIIITSIGDAKLIARGGAVGIRTKNGYDLLLENANLDLTGTSSAEVATPLSTCYGDIVINGGNINAETTYSFCVSAFSGGNITITDANVNLVSTYAKASYTAPLSAEYGTVTINSGNVSVINELDTSNSGTGIKGKYVVINGGNVHTEAPQYGIQLKNIEINGGTVYASSNVASATDKANVYRAFEGNPSLAGYTDAFDVESLDYGNTTASAGNTTWHTFNQWPGTYYYRYQVKISPHEHIWGETAAVAAECAGEGALAKACSVCGAVEAVNVVAGAGDHNVVVDEAVAPTCFKAGKTEGSHCADCGVVLAAQQTIPATGHKNFTDTVIKTHQVSCTSAGYYELSVNCADCGYRVIHDTYYFQNDTRGHTVNYYAPYAAKCGVSGRNAPNSSVAAYNICGNCDVYRSGTGAWASVNYQTKIYAAPLDHTWVAAEETTTGCGDTLTTYTCSGCGETKLVPADTSLHTNVVEVAAVEPGCMTPGKTAGTICGDCGALLSGCELVDATEHTWGDWVYTGVSCTTAGTRTRICTTCGAEDLPNCDSKGVAIESDGQTVNAMGHLLGELTILETKQPTCLADGYQIVKIDACTRCDQEDITKTVVLPKQPSSHNWIDADCENPKKCSDCGVTEGEAKGHTEVEIPAVECSCTATGLTAGVKCSDCGEILVEQTEVPAGHKVVEVERVEPTTTAVGYTAGTKCSRCGEILSGCEEIPMLRTASVKIMNTTTLTVTEGGVAVYAKSVSGTAYNAAGEEVGLYWKSASGTADNWNVKFEYPMGGVPTLTLKDATFDYYDDAGNIMYTEADGTGVLNSAHSGIFPNSVMSDLKIVLQGTNHIEAGYGTIRHSYGDNTLGNVTVVGEEGSSLSGHTRTLGAFNMNSGYNLTLENVNLDVSSGRVAPLGTTNGSITINGGNLKIRNTNGHCISAGAGGLTINNAVLDLNATFSSGTTAGAISACSSDNTSGGAITITNSQITATGNGSAIRAFEDVVINDSDISGELLFGITSAQGNIKINGGEIELTVVDKAFGSTPDLSGYEGWNAVAGVSKDTAKVVTDASALASAKYVKISAEPIAPACDHANTTTTEVVTKEAACAEAGSKTVTVTCECGEVISTEIVEIAALGHAFDDEFDTECNNGCGTTQEPATYADAIGTNSDSYGTLAVDGNTVTLNAQGEVVCKPSATNPAVWGWWIGYKVTVPDGINAANVTFVRPDGSTGILSNALDTDTEANFYVTAKGATVNQQTYKFDWNSDGIYDLTMIVDLSGITTVHAYKAVVTEPTCTEAGFTTYTCACGETYTADKVAALGHAFDDEFDTECNNGCGTTQEPATYADAIGTNSDSYGTLAVDGNTVTLNAQGEVVCKPSATDPAVWGWWIGYKVTVPEGINAANVTFVRPDGSTGILSNALDTDTEANFYVTAKGATVNQQTYKFDWNSDGIYDLTVIVDLSGITTVHAYEVVVTDPDCTNAGATTYTCPCGATYSEEIPAKGHTEKTTVETTEATCTGAGAVKTVVTCEVCGETISETVEEIPAKGHSYADDAATECSVCGAVRATITVVDDEVSVNANGMSDIKVHVFNVTGKEVADIDVWNDLKAADPDFVTYTKNPFELENGTYVLRVQYTDAEGNDRADSHKVVIDYTPAAVTPPTIEVNGNAVSVDANGLTNVVVHVFNVAGKEIADIDDWSQLKEADPNFKSYVKDSFVLENGEYVLRVQYCGADGEAYADSHAITVNYTLVDPTATVNGNTVTVKGTAVTVKKIHVFCVEGKEIADIDDWSQLKEADPAFKSYKKDKIQVKNAGEYVLRIEYVDENGVERKVSLAVTVA